MYFKTEKKRFYISLKENRKNQWKNENKELTQPTSPTEVKTELALSYFHQSSIPQHPGAELCATSALTAKPLLTFSTYSYPRSFAVEPFSQN